MGPGIGSMENGIGGDGEMKTNGDIEFEDFERMDGAIMREEKKR